jgi:hypothetical protein
MFKMSARDEDEEWLMAGCYVCEKRGYKENGGCKCLQYPDVPCYCNHYPEMTDDEIQKELDELLKEDD